MARAPALVRSRASLIESWKWNIEGEERLMSELANRETRQICRVSRRIPLHMMNQEIMLMSELANIKSGKFPDLGRRPLHTMN